MVIMGGRFDGFGGVESVGLVSRGQQGQGAIVRGITSRVLDVFVVVLVSVAALPDAACADVVAAYELVEPAVAPGGGVVAVTQGGPGQPLIITLDDTPGDHTIKVQFVADVDVTTPLIAYSIEWTTLSGTVEVTDFSYLGPFDFDLVVPPDLILAAGPGTILDEAAQVTFSMPPSGMLELFEATLVVTVPTDEIQIFSRVGESEWASTAQDFSILIGDSDPLPGYWTGDESSTPSIIIRTFAAPPVDCDSNTIPDADEIAGQPDLDCDTNGTLDRCGIAAGAADCNGNAIPDSCEVAAGAADCDTNGVLDTCELAAAPSDDCNWNGVPDRCEIAREAASDCNKNGRPDGCDVASAASADTNGNGVPDECESTDASQDPQADDNDSTAHAVDRQSLRSFLALLFGIPGEGGMSLAGVTYSFLGPIGIPMSAFLGGLELLNLPERVLLFNLTYALLDAILP